MTSHPMSPNHDTIAAQPPRRETSLILLLGASFGMFTGSFVLDQAFRWTDPLHGIANGVFHMSIIGVVWLLEGLLPGLLIYGLYRWRGWQRFRSLVIVSPSLVLCASVITGLIFSPTTPASRLKRFTGIDLPASAHDIRTDFTGGGICDYGDTYYFRCDPKETDALVEALRLHFVEPRSSEAFGRISPEWPDLSEWSDRSAYAGETADGVWFYYFVTDAAREQVWLHIGCI